MNNIGLIGYKLNHREEIIIAFCDPILTCNSNGICNDDGTCNCEPVFYGETCLSKLIKFWDKYLLNFKTNIFISFFFRSCMSLSLYM